MDGVGQQAQGLETPIVKAEEGPQADVVAAALHGAVLPVEPPEEIRLVARGVHRAVGGPVVGFLEDLVGADAGRLHLAVALHVQRCAIDIDAADLAVRRFDRIDHAHGVGDDVGVVVGVFAVVDHQALVAAADEDSHFGAELVVG